MFNTKQVTTQGITNRVGKEWSSHILLLLHILLFEHLFTYIYTLYLIIIYVSMHLYIY